MFAKKIVSLSRLRYTIAGFEFTLTNPTLHLIMNQKEQRLEASRNEWKAKNKARYEETKALKMRLQETLESRDKWKATSNEMERALTQLERVQLEKDKIMKALATELEDFKKNIRFK